MKRKKAQSSPQAEKDDQQRERKDTITQLT